MRPRITSAESCARERSRCLEVGDRGRQHENADEIAIGFLAQLLRALPVDVEQHVAPLCQRRFDRSARVP